MGTNTPHTCIPGLVWQKQARRFSQFELKVGELGFPIHFVCVSAALYHRGVRGRHFPLRWIWPIATKLLIEASFSTLARGLIHEISSWTSTIKGFVKARGKTGESLLLKTFNYDVSLVPRQKETFLTKNKAQNIILEHLASTKLPFLSNPTPPTSFPTHNRNDCCYGCKVFFYFRLHDGAVHAGSIKTEKNDNLFFLAREEKPCQQARE